MNINGIKDFLSFIKTFKILQTSSIVALGLTIRLIKKVCVRKISLANYGGIIKISINWPFIYLLIIYSWQVI